MIAKTLKVIAKGEDWTFARKYLVYGDVMIDDKDPEVIKCIEDATQCLKVTADDIEVKCSMIRK